MPDVTQSTPSHTQQAFEQTVLDVVTSGWDSDQLRHLANLALALSIEMDEADNA